MVQDGFDELDGWCVKSNEEVAKTSEDRYAATHAGTKDDCCKGEKVGTCRFLGLKVSATGYHSFQ